jgi:hypothetical protein
LTDVRKYEFQIAGCVSIKNGGGVTSTNLTGVVEDDLGVEGSGLLGGVVLGVRGDTLVTNILDRDIPEIMSGIIREC